MAVSEAGSSGTEDSQVDSDAEVDVVYDSEAELRRVPVTQQINACRDDILTCREEVARVRV